MMTSTVKKDTATSPFPENDQEEQHEVEAATGLSLSAHTDL